MTRLAALAIATTLIGCGGSTASAPASEAPDAGPPSHGSPVLEPSPDEPVPDAMVSEAAPIDAGAPSEAATDAAPEPAKPPPFPAYSKGACPKLVAGPTAATSLNTAFPTGSDKRDFRLIVPKSYDGTRKYPLMFAYHWLNSSSASIIEDGELETAAEQMGFIVVAPDNLEKDGKKAYQFTWPFAEVWGQASELGFFDDMLACVSEQYAIDERHVHAVGVSAGALWVSYLSTTDRVKWLASVESLSGGLGEDPSGTWKMEYAHQPNDFPALVLWGGSTDWMILSFEQASKKYRDALLADHHFVVTCTHDKGHAIPPIDPPPGGGTKFKSIWQFFVDHPYGTTRATSPWRDGFPKDAGVPSWCQIPAGK
jgi:hypothetical protein